MPNKNLYFKSEEELEQIILQEKANGTPDLEIGRKYGVTYRYIERLITKSKGLNISSLNVSKKIKTFSPKDFKEEQTTVWSFKQRGKWATHSGEYRGNWSPYIPRNVILKYSKLGELVLDYFCGAGTTAVEAKLLGRRCIAFDINDKAIELARKNVNFDTTSNHLLDFWEDNNQLEMYEPELLVADARDLSSLNDNSVDLICSHPPYANIIHYTDRKEGDLSFFDIDDFLNEMSKVAKESFRVLKPGRQCAILIGDTRRKKYVIPLGFKLINVYLDVGFKLRELVIKRQHNCKTTGFWYANSVKYNFLLLAHEHLPIFVKPEYTVSSSIKEEEVGYGLVVPTKEKISIKRKLDELETTTVWVLPENDFDKILNKNVINRYSNGNGYSTITFASHSKNEKLFTHDTKKEIGLFFIKSSILNDILSHFNIESYLNEVKEIVNQNLPKIIKGGFIVIQTQDVRMDGYIKPLAKMIIDIIDFENLWLKEIIIVTQRNTNGNGDNFYDSEYFKINHQYLLVYEKII